MVPTVTLLLVGFRRLPGEQAAVDGVGSPGDKRGVVRGEERDDGGDLRGAAQPPRRVRRDDLALGRARIVVALDVRAELLGLDEARSDAVDPDARARVVEGHLA